MIIQGNNTTYGKCVNCVQGVISPLLANVALHGLEKDTKNSLAKDLLEDFKKKTGRSSNIKAQTAISIIRYADDGVPRM
jgi:retron-type reverse transcriptase